MIDAETVDRALNGLHRSAIAMVEQALSELALAPAPGSIGRCVCVATVRQLGLDLQTLADAAMVLIRASEVS
jgi:hypothetical protein